MNRLPKNGQLTLPEVRPRAAPLFPAMSYTLPGAAARRILAAQEGIRYREEFPGFRIGRETLAPKRKRSCYGEVPSLFIFLLSFFYIF
jgi:hypothetical protein